ncbi:hypothetical protein BV898_19443 [Hypsibius exemplaris]|uniref:Uncharacterized protein n=1 Tax=Hypsibius exemplaris TaxID=2072580 RepID=A0A9X6NLQ5_HYPEX|nr:hypothetical protein BV898_19443 [Hypsibius exemplaris]
MDDQPPVTNRDLHRSIYQNGSTSDCVVLVPEQAGKRKIVHSIGELARGNYEPATTMRLRSPVIREGSRARRAVHILYGPDRGVTGSMNYELGSIFSLSFMALESVVAMCCL